MVDETDLFELVYSRPDSAPWTYPEVPSEITDLVERKVIVPPCGVLEVGCGEGYNAIFLASKGFDVKAIDQSRNAITFARRNAERSSLMVDFQVQDYHGLAKSEERYDFIFDWRFFHEIVDETEREEYLQSVSQLLRSGGKYLSVAFSGDSDFMGTGKLRTSPIGKVIYFAELEDSRRLIGKHLRVLDSRHILVPQKPDLSIKANYVLAEK